MSEGNTVQMSATATDIFRKAVTYILNDWPSLDLAIENGMGGHEASAKRSWMISTITETMIRGVDLDVEDYLGEIIDAEFDTAIQDGSLEYNSRWIEKFYKDCLSGKDQDVDFAITQASLKKMSLDRVKMPAPVCETKPEDNSDTGEEDEEEDE